MAQKYLKNCSPFLALKGMKIKATLKSHLTSVRMGTINKITYNKYQQGHGGRETHFPHGIGSGTLKWGRPSGSHCGKTNKSKIKEGGIYHMTQLSKSLANAQRTQCLTLQTLAQPWPLMLCPQQLENGNNLSVSQLMNR